MIISYCHFKYLNKIMLSYRCDRVKIRRSNYVKIKYYCLYLRLNFKKNSRATFAAEKKFYYTMIFDIHKLVVNFYFLFQINSFRN